MSVAPASPPAADIAAIPKTQAVLIASGRRPVLLDLLPWYTEPDAATLAGHAAAATDQEAIAMRIDSDSHIARASTHILSGSVRRAA